MADMTNTGFGLLSEYGLDLGEERDVRSKLRQQRIADAMKFVHVPQGYDGKTVPGAAQAQAGGMFGAALGNALGEKFGGPGYSMPPEIATRLKTAEGVKSDFAKWTEMNKDATAQARVEKYQELVATHAMQNGLTDVGISALKGLDDQRRLRQKQDLELEKLGLEVDVDRATKDAEISKRLYESGKAGMITVFPRGSMNPNSGVTGWLDPKTGRVLVSGEDGQPRELKSYEYTLERPQWMPGLGGGGGSGGGGSSDAVNKSEKGKVRLAVADGIRLNQKYIAVFDLLRDANKAKVGPIQGRIGALTSAANSWLGFAEQLATLTQPTGKIPTIMGSTDSGEIVSFDTPADRQAFLKRNERWIRRNVPNLPEKADYADRMAAIMIELAYAKAMAAEGGSVRSLSDNDFRNAMRAVGTHINDPQALANLLLADADRAYESLQAGLSTYDDDQLREMVRGDAFERLAGTRQTLDDYRSGKAWQLPAPPAPPAPAATQAGGAGAAPVAPVIEDWVRGPDGKLRKAQK